MMYVITHLALCLGSGLVCVAFGALIWFGLGWLDRRFPGLMLWLLED